MKRPTRTATCKLWKNNMCHYTAKECPFAHYEVHPPAQSSLDTASVTALIGDPQLTSQLGHDFDATANQLHVTVESDGFEAKDTSTLPNIWDDSVDVAKTWHLEQLTVKESQIARHHNLTALFALPTHLNGQRYAAKEVLEEVLAHVLSGERRPLVLVFAGPPSSGKTEFASKMGKLLSVPQQLVDCSEIRHETDLIGPHAPYQNWQIGTCFNNDLVRDSGKRSVVVLEEFDRATDEVRQSLLRVLDKGIYTDRRNRNQFDCTKTIWIINTNSVDGLITDFFRTHLADKPLSKQANAPYSKLEKDMRKAFGGAFGHQLAGRVTAIIPFFPSFADGKVGMERTGVQENQDSYEDNMTLNKAMAGEVIISK